MEIITNEDKAAELFPDVPNMECLCLGVREKLTKMAAWKDQQFAAYREALIEKACEAYKKDLIQCQRIMTNINKTAKNIIDVEGSVCDFRKLLEEMK